jgi:hypothetical protein
MATYSPTKTQEELAQSTDLGVPVLNAGTLPLNVDDKSDEIKTVEVVGYVAIAGIEEPIETVPKITVSGRPVGLRVSTTAVRLAASNVSRKAIAISNNGTGTLYLGTDQSVASSGVAMGIGVSATLSLTDSGDGVFVGEWWGIYSASASSQNVSVLELV